MRSQEPLIVQPIDVAADPELSDEIAFNNADLGAVENFSDIEKSINGFQMPQSDQPMFGTNQIEQQGNLENTQGALNLPLFEDIQPGGSFGPTESGFDPSMSPTILPSASDREIAMRRNAQRSGIGSLI
jgi:hypothetical protein